MIPIMGQTDIPLPSSETGITLDELIRRRNYYGWYPCLTELDRVEYPEFNFVEYKEVKNGTTWEQ